MARRPTSNAYGRTHFRSPVAQNYPYRANYPWPSQQAGQIGEWVWDSVSGAPFPLIYAQDSQFGVVDGRDGATYDTDLEQHELSPTMIGSYVPPRYGPFTNLPTVSAEDPQGALPPADPPPVPTPGDPTTYYVSPTGSDAADGSQMTPWQTLQHAADTMVDGDSCTVGDGTYAEGMTIRTDGLIFVAESASHVINSSAHNDIITIRTADRVSLRGLRTADAIMHGFNVSHSDNVTLTDCEALACGTGILTAYSNYTIIDGGVWSNSRNQHGIYISNHSHYPTVRNIASGNCTGNARSGLQINADRQAANDPPDHVGPILGAVIEDCVFTANNTTGVSAQIALFGCWSATLTNVQCLNGVFGGINLSNDDNHSAAGLNYGSKDCVFNGVTVTGLRGVSVKSGSTNLSMDDLTVTITAGPCIDYDNYSFPPMSLGATYSLTTTGAGFKAFQNSSTGADYTVAEWRALPQ